MTKLFLILSTVALLGAAGVGIANRSTFINVRNEKDDINTQIKGHLANYHDTYEGDFDKKIDGIKNTRRTLAENEANIELAQSTIRTKKAEIDTLKAEEAPLDEEIAQIQKVIDALMAKFPGIDLATLPAKMEELRLEEKGLTEEVTALTAEGELISKKLKSNQSVVTRLKENQRERSVGISRNSMEATITAVNQDWGFVVFGAGKNNGVTNESKLLIKRGPSIIGRLKIVSIEPRITVANIDRESLARGARVLPGDKVIFGNLQN